MNIAKKEDILKILEKEKLAYIATTNGKFVDNAVVCYSHQDLNLYFGCYEDTLKGKYLAQNDYAAFAIGTLQIHGKVRKIKYKSSEYKEKIQSYATKWPQYLHVFDKEKNQLYELVPLVIWNYNPKKGEMNRDVLILDQDYYTELDPYLAKKEYKYKSTI
ncbi:MAG: hypothetical protein MJB14_21560 [Spirochaetes bacterium]|nr:hypothetical protein [Spirochaetota bacterium]